VIQWLRAKTNPVPLQYDILFILDTGEVMIGTPSPRHNVVGWSVVNRPEWLFSEHQVSRSSSFRRCRGEDHPKVYIADADCDLIRTLYEAGGISYQQIADKYECSKSTIRDIVKCRTRA
jgi:hypothetical protein